MHLLFSSKIEASFNPAKVLMEWFSEKGSCWEYGKHKMVDTKVDGILDVPTDFESEGLVVLSTHRSEREYPTLTVHVPGNWSDAELGGESRTLNTVMGSGMKRVLKGLAVGNEKYSLGWNVNMEVDHHGPTCNLPIMFVEIGSSAKEWGNLDAAKIVAEAVMGMLESEERYESWFCVGGGHYSQEFTKLGLHSNDKCAGHILPKYNIEKLKMDTFKQAMEKSVEETQRVLIEKKGANSWQKDIVLELAKEYGAEVEIYK